MDTTTPPERRPIALLFATSGHSGVDRVVANLVHEFGKRSFAFDLLTIRGHGPHLASLPANVRSVELGAAHRDTALLPLFRYLRSTRPRALLTAHHRLNRCALLARRLARVDLRVVLRMGMSPEGTAGMRGSRSARRRIRSMRYWYPRGDALVTPSAGVGEALVSMGCVARERLHVIPNPIVNEALHRRAAQLPGHSWFQPGAPPVVLGAGTLTPRKDFATLMRGFARVRGQRAARLVILGEGPERPRLEALARELGIHDCCWLPGHVADPYPYMAAAEVFALTSRGEGSGAVLVEALACGTSAVATDCPSGPAETLGAGRYGPLVAVGDESGLAQAIEALLERPTPADARQAAIAPFAASVAADRYLAALGVMS